MPFISKGQDKLPEYFNYQAVINDDEGKPVSGKEITVEVTIFQETVEKYKELHNVTTSDLGLFSVEIGSGTPINGVFSDINWLEVSDGYYYLQVRVDFGRSEFLNGMNDLGKTKFSTVPYALAAQNAKNAETAETAKTAKTAGKATNMTLSDLTDINVSNAAEGQVLTFDGSNWIAKTVTSGGVSIENLKELNDVSISSATDGQVLTFDNGTGKWVNKSVAAAKYNLEDLQNVKITNIADGQILKYDASSEKWVNAAEGDMWKKATTEGKQGIYTTQNVGIGLENNSEGILEIGKTDTKKTIIEGGYIRIKDGSLYLGNKENSPTKESNGAYSIASFGDACQNSIAFGTTDSKSKTTNYGTIAVGEGCEAGALCSAAFGRGTITENGQPGQFACGKYNIDPQKIEDTYPLFIVGNGTGTTVTARSNAFEVYTTGNATLAGTLTQSSDSRLKNNVTNIGSALENVVKLRGVTFNWDLTKQPSADKKLQYGFIAQEVEKVFPELVTTDSKGFKTLNYIGVIPVLTEAVKELKQENDELKSTIQDLIKRIEALEKK